MDTSVWTEADCCDFIQAAGGKGNILELTSCFTRLRLHLRDRDKADTEKLAALPLVKGILTRTEELHLIIGVDAAGICLQCQALLA